MKHRSAPQILNQRTLEHDHRRLAELLVPGMRVLDAGCGTGSITAGIARAVGQTGQVVGIDRDQVLLEEARGAHGSLPNLEFEQADLTDYQPAQGFDIATAARVLQWIASPQRALDRLCAAVEPGGWVVVLDYNHSAHTWEPAARPEFQRFYEAFLEWREANGWSNRIADELPKMFREVGLVDVESTDQTETDLTRIASIWTHMVESLGPALIEGGFLSETQCTAAREANEAWRTGEGRAVTFALRTITGRVQL